MDREIALYGGSFNPPGRYHREVAERLLHDFDEVVLLPCGPRPDRPKTSDVEPIHRASMVDLNFRGLDRLQIEFSDVENMVFTREWQYEEMYRDRGRTWHVVPERFVRDGRHGRSTIQQTWERGMELWNEARFVVVQSSSIPLDPADLPPRHRLIRVPQISTSEEIRGQIFNDLPIGSELLPEVLLYIQRHKIYRGVAAPRQTRFRTEKLRLRIVADERNPEARRVAEALGPHRDDVNPNLIVPIGGDGTMLRAIREHWRHRLPFYGINTGHLGFLLNDAHHLDLCNQDLILYQLPLLWVEIEDLDGNHATALAFNDAWVERATGQTAWLRLSVNEHERIRLVVADGVLVATAAGSTSYARAMGATPLPLNTPALLLVGSNVLKPVHWRPAVLPMDSRVTISTLDPDKRPLHAFIDGEPRGRVRQVRVRASNIAAAELAFLPTHDPVFKLAKIQFPWEERDRGYSP